MIVFVLPASLATFWAARSSRAVFRPDYQVLVARKQRAAVQVRQRVLLGLGLALAMFIQFWTLLFLVLGVLVASGLIRTV